MPRVHFNKLEKGGGKQLMTMLDTCINNMASLGFELRLPERKAGVNCCRQIFSKPTTVIWSLF